MCYYGGEGVLMLSVEFICVTAQIKRAEGTQGKGWVACLPTGIVLLFLFTTTTMQRPPMKAITIDVPADGAVSLGAALVALAVAAHLTVVDVHAGVTGGLVADAAVGGGVAVDMGKATRSSQVRSG